jgi:hypothetical protein
VEFAERLLDPAGAMLASFDLDGDMGYGFLNWSTARSRIPTPTPATSHGAMRRTS